MDMVVARRTRRMRGRASRAYHHLMWHRLILTIRQTNNNFSIVWCYKMLVSLSAWILTCIWCIRWSKVAQKGWIDLKKLLANPRTTLSAKRYSFHNPLQQSDSLSPLVVSNACASSTLGYQGWIMKMVNTTTTTLWGETRRRRRRRRKNVYKTTPKPWMMVVIMKICLYVRTFWRYTDVHESPWTDGENSAALAACLWDVSGYFFSFTTEKKVSNPPSLHASFLLPHLPYPFYPDRLRN